MKIKSYEGIGIFPTVFFANVVPCRAHLGRTQNGIVRICGDEIDGLFRKQPMYKPLLQDAERMEYMRAVYLIAEIEFLTQADGPVGAENQAAITFRMGDDGDIAIPEEQMDGRFDPAKGRLISEFNEHI